MKSLDGEVIIITGASRGIGEATAFELAARGAKVVLAARTREALEQVAEAIRGRGGEAQVVNCDVSDYDAVGALVRSALERFGAVTGLINNAGVIEPIARLEDSVAVAWEEAVKIDLIGPYNGLRALLPHFYRQGRGVIINLSSGAARRPLEGWSAYCASKAGLAMLTQVVALEAEDRGVRVYGFAPGVVDTEMQVRIRRSGINEVSRLPREKLASSADAARAIAWLCSKAAGDLSGQELDIRDPELRRRSGLEVSP